MKPRAVLLTFGFFLLWGACVHVSANPAHPTGPDEKTFKERSIEFQGDGKRATLKLAYPEPDEIVDWVDGKTVNVYEKSQALLGMNFNYTGHFWQGVFGRVGLDVEVKENQSGSPGWNDLSDLLHVLEAKQISRNALTKNEDPKNRQEWFVPEMSELNGAKCIKQLVKNGSDGGGELHFYFLFTKDRVVEVKFPLVDNSNRPGLAPSDWRPRAEAFLKKLVSLTKFQEN